MPRSAKTELIPQRFALCAAALSPRASFTSSPCVRDLPPHPVIEEKPKGLLSEDIAPNALEALLAALGSCLAVGIHANAVARRIPIRRLELELEADINTTAVWGGERSGSEDRF